MTTTYDGVREGLRTGTSRWTTRVTLGLLALVVLAGAVGLLGVRNATATASAGGWTLAVDYPRLARAGLDTPFGITVTNPDGVGDEVTIALSQDYLTIFESQGVVPEPAEVSTDGTYQYLTVTAEPGATRVRLDFDVYVQPSSQEGEQARVFVVDPDTRERLVQTDIRTTLVP